jgi:HAD superfamily hydrolase (TIGR01450 family)
MNGFLKHIECFLLDMDGTVHISGVPIEGAAAAVERMRKQGSVFFITNNTSVSRSDYIKKLCGMKISASEKDVYTAGNATVSYLNSEHGGKRVFLLGTDALKSEFSAGGVRLDYGDPELVVIGFDTALTYANLSAACSHIRRGVPYLCTHPDINCPVKGGYIPDVGSFAALIEKSTGKKPFIICGKPFKPMGDAIKRLTGCPPSKIAMIGDRLSTDMRFAEANGFVSVLTLTGEAALEDLQKSGQRVDFIIDSVARWDA